MLRLSLFSFAIANFIIMIGRHSASKLFESQCIIKSYIKNYIISFGILFPNQPDDHEMIPLLMGIQASTPDCSAPYLTPITSWFKISLNEI